MLSLVKELLAGKPPEGHYGLLAEFESATELWDAAREAFYAQAAVPATLLLVVSFISVALLVRRGDIQA